MKEKKLRIEDALNATRAAIEEGIIPGGGIALLKAIPALEKIEAEGDEMTGVNIIKHALEAPLRQIATNAGMEGSVIVENVKKNNDPNYGYDALTGEFGDMVAKGIIDPTKVTRSALQNAASVASMVLTTESLVTDIPEPEPAASGGGNNMPMY